MKQKKILLMGYIGQKNFGDDLLFDIAIQEIKNIPNIEVHTVITSETLNPDYLYNYYPALKIIKFQSKIPLLFFKKYSKVYYIGGGVFFDYRSRIDSMTFYKNYISNFIRYYVPKLTGTSFAGVGLGIGPYFCNRTKTLHYQIIKNFDVLGVRDKVSFNLAQSMGFRTPLLSNDLSLKLIDDLQVLNNEADNSREIIICPRSYAHNVDFEKHLEELIHFAKSLKKEGYKTHWVFLQDDNVELLDTLKNDFKVTIWDPFNMTIQEFIQLFIGVKMVLTSRMHSIFLAGMLTTPFIAISIHQKLIFASNLFYDDPIIIDPLSPIEKYEEAFEKINFKKISLKKAYNEKLALQELDSILNKWLSK